MFTNAPKIQSRTAQPIIGLNKKLMVKTLTCGAVLEITPRMMSCPKVASNTGAAI